ncbi:unnamed protein product, partial [Cyprideis torosa]
TQVKEHGFTKTIKVSSFKASFASIPVPSTIRSSIRERSEEISVSGHEVDEMRGDQFIESTADHEERELRHLQSMVLASSSGKRRWILAVGSLLAAHYL